MKPSGRPLDRSQQAWVQSKYKLAFPHLTRIESNEDVETQKRGVDLYIHLLGEASTRVEEKVRWRYYNDILLEDWSVYEEQKLGWARDMSKITEYLAYYFPETRVFWIMCYPALRHWFLENYEIILHPILRDRIRRLGKENEYIWGKTESPGYNYHTANIPVPLDTFDPAWFRKNFWIY